MDNLSQSPSGPAARVDEFMKLHAQHQRRLYLYLLSLVHNVADAEDLLQQTSYILWTKFDDFQSGSNFVHWACRIGYLEVLKFREGRKQAELPLSPRFLERIRDKMPEFSEMLEGALTPFAIAENTLTSRTGCSSRAVTRLAPASRHWPLNCGAPFDRFRSR